MGARVMEWWSGGVMLGSGSYVWLMEKTTIARVDVKEVADVTEVVEAFAPPPTLLFE
jgi:hypothetical protein